jgi:quercetin dioxygenase-like cupin family protein
MTPVRHQVSGQALQFALQEEIGTVKRELTGTATRSARTLVKDGPLRVTLVGVNPGGELRPHKADGPITLQVLEGEIHFEAEGQRWTLSAGTLFALDAGITHSVQSPTGGIFLLTVVAVSGGSAADVSKDATTR